MVGGQGVKISPRHVVKEHYSIDTDKTVQPFMCAEGILKALSNVMKRVSED